MSRDIDEPRLLKGTAMCAALYIERTPRVEDVVRLHDNACRLFQDANHPVNAIEAFARGEPIVVATSDELIRGLRSGELADYCLLSLRGAEVDFRDWRAIAWLDCQTGIICVCMVADEVVSVSSWLRSACQLTEGFDVRYGIAYQLPLAEHPDSYAHGTPAYSLAYAAKTKEERNRLEAWSRELIGKRRYLSGYFRGAYPASVLSESHLQRANLRSLRVGSVSTLTSGLWLWELRDAELKEADSILDAAGLLIK